MAVIRISFDRINFTDTRISMPYYIHVPQGRTARMSRELLATDLIGLYTDSFSTCHIVALVSKDRISMTHADSKTPVNAIEQEIQWVGEECEKIIIYRDFRKLSDFKDALSHRSSASDPNGLRGLSLNTELLGQKNGCIHIPVPDETHSIALSLNENSENIIHKNISTFKIDDKKTDVLLRHPKEKEFLSVHKIEAAICFASSSPIEKKNLIFDGSSWSNILDNEFKIYHSDMSLIKSYLNKIKKSEYFMKMVGALIEVRDEILEKNKHLSCPGDKMSDSIEVMKYFQDYLFPDMTPVKIFISDLKEILSDYEEKNKKEQSYYPMHTTDDAKVLSELKSTIKGTSEGTSDSFNLLKKIIEAYQMTTHKSEFKNYLLDNLKLAKRNYNERLEYIMNEKHLNEWEAIKKNLASKKQKSDIVYLRTDASLELGKESPEFFMMFKGVFSKKERQKENLVKKYNLNDRSIAELERGLRKAVANNEVEDLDHFIDHFIDININAKDPKEGKTALHWAVGKGFRQCVEKLIQRGADPSITDIRGQDPTKYTSNQEILELLQSGKRSSNSPHF